MGIEKGEAFQQRDIYIDYDFEDVMFRWDHRQGQVFVKFYGQSECIEPVPQGNGLYNEALRFGEEITREAYEAGKPRE
ncbi:hypothetical protein [Metapseudomonas otitidis]|uniref:WGR domain-containing protein n=1 Tax=Metapseudomonas otitidis TaxID=319939 RepID=A0ABU3XKQ7_9GAMM|nr:hypothetical protein [Pseudomonas otitidis]MBO2927706.1 hypothetical protein [Pseudomonas otitidis]MDH0339814.1 hypothetical protein [Pseudomonas otitidis]MDH1108173.1 hypothetical protein [Pseudomonas otitidis]MDH1160749.1 hypothetical protein [Pseudomonas otitidis]MDH1163140.1 hypothetical protein [Pseudomonas otitidis]